MNQTHIGIIGAGAQGSAIAYALILNNLVQKVLLVDRRPEKAALRAADLNLAAPSQGIRVHASGYEDLGGCFAIIIADTLTRRQDESRLHFLSRQVELYGESLPKILRHAPQAIFIVAATPVNIMTHTAAAHLAEGGVPPGRVMGFGTLLESYGFRRLLGDCLGLSPQLINGTILGGHGRQAVFPWSSTRIQSWTLESLMQLKGLELSRDFKREIERKVRENGPEGTNHTYSVAGAIARITRAMVRDEQTILPICRPRNRISRVENVTIALPHLIGREGILPGPPLDLEDEEWVALESSARVLRQALNELAL